MININLNLNLMKRNSYINNRLRMNQMIKNSTKSKTPSRIPNKKNQKNENILIYFKMKNQYKKIY